MPKLLTHRGDRGSKFSTKSWGNCYTSCITCAYMMFSIELWGFFLQENTVIYAKVSLFLGYGSEIYFVKLG